MKNFQQSMLNKFHSISLRLLTITCLLSLFCVSFFISTNTQAHEIRPAIVDFTFDKNGLFQLTIQHNIEALLSEIGSAHDDTSESNNAKKYDQLRKLSPTELNSEFEKFSPNLLQNMQLIFDKKVEPLQILDVDIPGVGDIELARDSVINIAGILPENIKSMSWKWDEKFGNAVLRISSEAEPELFSSYLVNGNESEQVPINIDCYNTDKTKKVEGCISQQSKWDVFKNYITVGFVHIILKV